MTVNVTALVTPPGVDTVTFLAVVAVRLLVIVKVAVTVVALTATRLLTVTPGPGAMLMAKAPLRLVPTKVTGTAVPRNPVLGVIDVSVGAATVLANSTAPASTALLVFRGFP